MRRHRTDDVPVAANVPTIFADSGSLIDGGTGSVQLFGGAIDVRGSTITGASLFADVRNPPASGAAQCDDNGQLSAPCLKAISALGRLRPGPRRNRAGSGTGPVCRGRNVTSGSVAIRSRETLAFGSESLPLAALAGGSITLESQAGDIELVGGASVSGGSVDLSAGGSLIGNGSLTSAGDVGITVGDSVFASSINAAGQLTAFGQTGGQPEALFSVPGSFIVGTLQLGADAAIAAGGDIVVGNVSLGGNNVDFDAGGLVSLDSTTQVGDIALSGSSAQFGRIGRRR